MEVSTHRLRQRLFYVVVGGLLGGGLALGCSGPRSGGETEATKSEVGARVYHVQFRMTEEKERATQALSRVIEWWKSRPPSKRPPLVRDAPSSNKAVSIQWKAPLYRVRLGPFATRPQAERVLRDARSTFPDAFVAPDRVGAP